MEIWVPPEISDTLPLCTLRRDTLECTFCTPHLLALRSLVNIDLAGKRDSDAPWHGSQCHMSEKYVLTAVTSQVFFQSFVAK